jgi:hypothetical protein
MPRCEAVESDAAIVVTRDRLDLSARNEDQTPAGFVISSDGTF